MGRRQSATRYRRVELRFAADDAMLAELISEAGQRGVELQQHLYDLLRGRFLARQGQSLAALLWVPGTPTSPPATTTTDEVADPTPPTGAAAAAAWADVLLDD